MSPVASIELFCLILATGEDRELAAREECQSTALVIHVVLLTGLIVFILNLTDSLATPCPSPLTVTKVGCVEQVVMIVVSVVIFDKKLTWANWCAVIVTSTGSLWFAQTEETGAWITACSSESSA
jgi:drug/metabolite transporter (DMT)-like permease